MNTIGQRVRDLSHLMDDRLTDAPACPTSCKLELTSRCNFACDYCAHTQHKRPSKDMDRGTYSLLIRRLYDAGVTQLGVFFLGESFLVDWLPDAIHEAKNLGFERVFLTTNGSVSTPDTVRQCMKAGLDSLKFSLNYSDPEQMRCVARVKASMYHAVDDNVMAARSVRDGGGYACHLAGSYIAYDGQQGERMRERVDLLSPYLDEVYQLPLYSQAGQVDAKEDRTEWIGNPGHIGDTVPAVPCWVLFSQAHVTYDGKMSACCFDHGGMFEMGDLVSQPFEEVWLSDAFRALRAAHLNKDVKGTACEACIYRT
jgi:radical SAM protein with 4Fe4S-binding SPASM domain